jgi:hypothetical protein
MSENIKYKIFTNSKLKNYKLMEPRHINSHIEIFSNNISEKYDVVHKLNYIQSNNFTTFDDANKYCNILQDKCKGIVTKNNNWSLISDIYDNNIINDPNYMTYIKNKTIVETLDDSDAAISNNIYIETFENKASKPDNTPEPENKSNSFVMTNTKMIMFVLLIMGTLLGSYYLYKKTNYYKSRMSDLDDFDY